MVRSHRTTAPNSDGAFFKPTAMPSERTPPNVIFFSIFKKFKVDFSFRCIVFVGARDFGGSEAKIIYFDIAMFGIAKKTRV
jgi:hypothetical protein